MPVITEGAGAKVENLIRIPSDVSRQRAHSAATRVYHRDAPVRQSFLRRSSTAPAPLAQFIRGGRGGEVRLKVYLSLLWIASKSPHQTDFRAEAIAELLNLPEARTLGRRRVSDALQWLAAHGFVELERRPGRTSVVYLRNDGGSLRNYVPPGAITGERYIKLPAGFWVNQWIVRLSGAAVALLLVLLDQYSGSRKQTEFWISPRLARDIYGLSRDTWTKGIAELSRSGIVSVDRYAVNDDDFGWSRLRNVYTLDMGQFDLRDAEAGAKRKSKKDSANGGVRVQHDLTAPTV